jgi:phosphopantothenoylcysteine decarboxylase/phosphopantothenate--cysteine ligase
VTLVRGVVGPRPVATGTSAPAGDDLAFADLHRVETTAEMVDAAANEATGADALVSAAAISDYTMDAVAEKIRSGKDDVTLDLVPTPKLLDRVRSDNPDLVMAGFKLETSGDDGAMIEAARDVIDRVGLSFVVANDASVMGEAVTRTLFVRPDGVEEFEGPKADLGLAVADGLVDAL